MAIRSTDITTNWRTKFQEQLLTKKEKNPGDGRLDEHKGQYELMSIIRGWFFCKLQSFIAYKAIEAGIPV